MFTFLSATASGLMLGLGLLGVQGRLVFAFVGLVGLSLVALRGRLSFAASLAFAVATSAASSPWLPGALENLGASPFESHAGWAIAIAWSGLPHLLGVCAILVAASGKCGGWAPFMAPVGVFALEEILVALPGSVPWTLLGYTAIDATSLANLAAIGGVPLISAVLAAGAFSVSNAFMQRVALRPLAEASPALAVIAFMGSVVATDTIGGENTDIIADERSRVVFTAIQPNIPRGERMRGSLQQLNADRLVRFTRKHLDREKTVPAYVVWPENALIDHGENHRLARDLASGSAQAVGIRLVLGITERSASESENGSFVRNSILLIEGNGNLSARVDKHRAVPVVEGFGGLIGQVASRAIGDAGLVARITEAKTVFPLDNSSGAVVALCFEVLFPQLVESRRPDVARVILNLADDSWTESERATAQLTNIARFRAIEQRLPLIRIAHGGLSAAFDPRGRELERLPLDQYGAIDLEVVAVKRVPFLTRLAPILLPIVIGTCVWWLCRIFASANDDAAGPAPGGSIL